MTTNNVKLGDHDFGDAMSKDEAIDAYTLLGWIGTSDSADLRTAMLDGSFTITNLLHPTPAVIGYMWQKREVNGVQRYLQWAAQFGFPLVFPSTNNLAVWAYVPVSAKQGDILGGYRVVTDGDVSEVGKPEWKVKMVQVGAVILE